MRNLSMVMMLVCLGCGTKVSFMPTNSAPRQLQARTVGEVEIFTSAKPDKEFVEVGILEVQQASDFSVDNEQAVMGKLREEAAKQGCDGLIITGANDAVTVMDGTGGTLKGYRGTCIVYKTAAASGGPSTSGSP
jgi:hypothetical protein